MNIIEIIGIIIHASGNIEGSNHGIDYISNVHKNRKPPFRYVDGYHCGYNYVIPENGEIQRGRKIGRITAGATGYNKGYVHICYIGGYDKNNKIKDTRTKAQKHALNILIESIIEGKVSHKLPNVIFNIKVIKGHRDLSPDINNNGKIDKFERIKSCPCYDAIPEYLHYLKR